MTMARTENEPMTSSLPVESVPPASADDWSMLFEGLPVGAFRSLPDGRFARVNTALARMLGYATEAEVLADAANDLALDWYVRPGRRAEVLAVLDREGSARGLVSEIHHRKTGQRMWISENAYVIRNTEGRVAFYEGTVEEVTGRVNTQQALEQREALLREVTAGVPGMVYRLRVAADCQLHYEFVSGGVRDLYGVEPEAVLADPLLLRRMQHPDDQQRLLAVLQAHLGNGQPLVLEFRICLDNGTQKWVRLSSSASFADPTGPRLYGVILDITAAKQAEQASLESDRRWKFVLECLGDGVWDTDLRTETCALSGPLCDTYDLPVDGNRSSWHAVVALMHPEDRPGLLATRQDHLDGKTPFYTYEQRMRQRDGNWVWVLSRGVVVQRDGDGKPLRMVGTHTDITQRREARALRQQRDRAEAADRTKSELMSRISHELRTPLNAILGFAQLLHMDKRPAGARQHEWAGHMLDSGQVLLGLIDDVLDLTRGQSMQFTLNITPVRLREAFDVSWQLLAAQARSQQVTLRPPAIDERLRVQADMKRLQQVLTNLLSNAIKYNRPGGDIVFEASQSGTEIEFSVIDSGRGIAAEYLERAFQPFDRLGAAHGKVPGTGLGLALCKQLVEAMGGTIGLASELGVGSRFTVRLPAAA